MPSVGDASNASIGETFSVGTLGSSTTSLSTGRSEIDSSSSLSSCEVSTFESPASSRISAVEDGSNVSIGAGCSSTCSSKSLGTSVGASMSWTGSSTVGVCCTSVVSVNSWTVVSIHDQN
jgi:hypothetical protein